MTVVTTRELTETISRISLLSPAQYAVVAQDLQPRCADPRALARQLLDRGWLTSFQINQIFLGRSAELVVGPYVLLERLGEGGGGQVFKARHQHMHRLVALKLVRRELLSDPAVVARFQREIQLISTLTHPHVVRAYDAGPVRANYFLAMEYVEGRDLARVLAEQGPLTPAQATLYLRQAALGLQHIHERGLVHRDIKPSNLFIVYRPVTLGEADAPHGVLMILDLGLARLHERRPGEITRNLTQNGAVMGTLDYIAPEQALDFHSVDIRADIYSLGCSFYHLLTGTPPFGGQTVAHKLLYHQQAVPPALEKLRPDLPPEVPRVVRKMMAKRPEDRYWAPGEIAQALPLSPADRVSFVQTVSLAAAPTATQANDRRSSGPVFWQQRRPVLIGAGLLTVLLVSLLVLRSGGSGGSAKSSASEGAPVYLTDLQELNFQGQVFGKHGFLGHNGNGRLSDVSPETARILVKGQLSRKGLSMWPPTGGAAWVTYRLGKKYNQFRTGVALHDGGSMNGSKVSFVVIGDGRTLWQSKRISGRDDYPQECVVRCTGVETLELQVTCSGLNAGVWPVWLDPHVLK